jgi:hypothetical protein
MVVSVIQWKCGPRLGALVLLTAFATKGARGKCTAPLLARAGHRQNVLAEQIVTFEYLWNMQWASM